MRQSLLLGFVTSLALLIGGCPANQESPTAVGGSPSPASPAPQTSPSTPQIKATPLSTTPSPAVESQLPVAGLTQTLPPEEQLKRATKGRVDPFSLISDIKPIKTVVPNPEAEKTSNNQPQPLKTVPPTPPAPPTRNNQTIRNNRPNSDRARVIIRRNILPSPRPPKAPQTNRQIASKPNTTPKNKPNTAIATNPKSPTTQVAVPPTPPLPPPPQFVPDLPKLPEPTLAQGVEVTGVVEVGGVPQAILKAPNEASRYVRAGQRVSNGQVLVKRIEMNRGPAPVVILEQYGIEVARQVGEKPSTTPSQPAAAPALPTTQPPA